MISIAVILFVLGLALGSFVNALVWRLNQQSKPKSKQPKANLSILNGRSICPNCRHQLAWYDLIPVLSWLSLSGRCRYCKRPISAQYPLIELISGLIFALSYLLWPHAVHQGGQWLLLAAWLISSVGLLALAVYDLRWLRLPNKIIYPTLAAAAAGRLAYSIFYDSRPLHALAMWAASVAVASGVFWALYHASEGRWIGYGDVRLGLVTGTLLAGPQYSLLMIFLASLLGSILAAPDLIRGKKTLASRLPFGPLLITATAFVVIFGQPLLNWYGRVMGIN
jgi:leader peptidase (prepilin peptidase) / N-methyltransferase